MFAVRCQNGVASFRRSGVAFVPHAWTFIEEATEAQKVERMLICVEVDGEDDPRLEAFPLPAAPVVAPPDTAPSAESEANDLAAAQLYISRLEAANAEMSADVADLRGQVVSLQEARTLLQAQVAASKKSEKDAAKKSKAEDKGDAADGVDASTGDSGAGSAADGASAVPDGAESVAAPAAEGAPADGVSGAADGGIVVAAAGA